MSSGHGIPQRRPSQCDLIAAVLRDHRFHIVAEIHSICGFSRLNSRIAELRSRRGMNIVCEHIPGAGKGPQAYRYRLLPPGVASDERGGVPSGGNRSPLSSDASLSAHADGITGEVSAAREASDYQLTLTGVAA